MCIARNKIDKKLFKYKRRCKKTQCNSLILNILRRKISVFVVILQNSFYNKIFHKNSDKYEVRLYFDVTFLSSVNSHDIFDLVANSQRDIDFVFWSTSSTTYASTIGDSPSI